MKRLAWTALALVGMLYLFLGWDGSRPRVVWSGDGPRLGRQGRIVLEIADRGRGLASVEVVLEAQDTEYPLVEESYAAAWPWQAGVMARSLALSPGASFPREELREGKFSLRVKVRDQGNLWLWSHETLERRSFELDLTPPSIELLRRRHYIRPGGSGAVFYHLSRDAVASGVQVGKHLFQGWALKRKPGMAVALFALAQDQDSAVPMWVWARDGAGNQARVSLPHQTLPGRFRRRRLPITDAFLGKVVPEILEHTPGLQARPTALETFLEINGPLRRRNNARIREISRSRMRERLWNQPFLQLSDSKVESVFADRRTYLYQGREVDHQTHLGFDLASVAHTPVECANDGVVVYASYLGIYGNCVLVDHGWGLLSLYGHLDRIDVQVGQKVRRGEALGMSGASGLAGGDHLHFGMILQGVEVNPLEWWDRHWIDQHLSAPLEQP